MAFATSDAHSHSLGNQGHLSVEYLYYHSVQKMPKPDPEAGVSLKEVSYALSSRGQPSETDWPYRDPAACPWVPPPQIGRIWQAKLDYTAGSLARLEELLQKGKPVLINIQLTPLFYLASKENSVVPFKVEMGFSLHSILAVGLANDGNEKLFLVRNSWGSGWGDDGHAWLSDAYLARHIHSIAHIAGNMSN